MFLVRGRAISLSAGTRLGPYQILSPIGAGGMGEVHKARDTRLKRDVAVKVVTERLGGDANALARFEREAMAVASLSHSNILAIHDFGTEGGVTYAVMELLEGETLRERLAGGALPVSRATDIAVQIAKGLAAAHAKGIVHRDLKPGNVFLTTEGQVKILDFGLAKVQAHEPVEGERPSEMPTAEAHTSAGAVLGTVGYMAPEQARGLPADARSDIFAFGVVLYEMLAGKRAFQGDTASDTLAAILTKDPAPLPPVTPPGLDRVVRRCLEKRPEDRFFTAHELLLALEVASSSSTPPTSAISVTLPAFLREPRHRWIFAGGVVLLFALAAAGLWFWKGRPSKPAAIPQTPTIKAIAVFPLDDLSADAAQSYFAPAMTEALNTKLTQIKSLRVIGQFSAEKCKREKMPLPQVAEVLGVDAVVQGSVVRVGDAVRISVRLLDARTDSNLWAESYERKLSDVLVLQGEVAQAIASSVRIAVSPEEKAKLAGRPVDPRAYEEFLSGLFDQAHTPGKEGVLAAIAHFEKAVELDPGFARAYGIMSQYYRLLWGNSWAPYETAHPLAKAAALKAVEVAPEEAAAHADLAGFLFVMERDLPGAEREARKAMELNDKDPGALNAFGHLLIFSGRVEESIELKRKVAELDPQNAYAWLGLWEPCAAAGRWDEAIWAVEKSMGTGLPNQAVAHACIAYLNAHKGDGGEALAAAGKARAAPGWEKDFTTVDVLALAYAVMGRRPEAQDMLRLLEPLRIGNTAEEMDLGVVYAWLGETERAFAHLEKGCSLPGSPALAIGYAYTFPKEFTKDPRYIALVRKVGLPVIYENGKAVEVVSR